MKTRLIISFMLLVVALSLQADTTIDPGNSYAYGANIGWVNAEGDVANGAVIGQAVCLGYMYGANVGWIHLGDGTPDNGMSYENNSAADYGINHDGAGNLTGYAYGSNIGWISFEQTYGQPKVNLLTGVLSGYAWSANTGWINLSGMVTLTLDSGPDTDADGIPDAWEYGHTNALGVLAGSNADVDHDGVSDSDEYGADTNPFDSNDYLWVTLDKAGGTTNTLSWATRPTRLYRLQSVAALTTGEWANTSSGLLHDNTGILIVHDEPATNNPARFYRVNAVLPLE